MHRGEHLVLLMFIEGGFAIAVVVAWSLLPRKPKVPPSLRLSDSMFFFNWGRAGERF